MSRTSFRANLPSIVCLNVKELLARSRLHIGILSDSNAIRTQNHLVRKQIVNGLAKLAYWLAKWLSVVYKLSGYGLKSRCCDVNNLFNK